MSLLVRSSSPALRRRWIGRVSTRRRCTGGDGGGGRGLGGGLAGGPRPDPGVGEGLATHGQGLFRGKAGWGWVGAGRAVPRVPRGALRASSAVRCLRTRPFRPFRPIGGLGAEPPSGDGEGP